LGAVKRLQARNLPHGHLRALGIAIAMAAEPKSPEKALPVSRA
jgi:hypothetical protein